MIKRNLFLSLSIAYLSLFAALQFAGQLRIQPKQFSSASPALVKKFLTSSRFDYALIGWTNNEWRGHTTYFSGIVSQKNAWYLVRVYEVPAAGNGDLTDPAVAFVAIQKSRADSILQQLNADEAFRYPQLALDSLGIGCPARRADGRMGLIEPADESLYTLAELRGETFRTIQKYASNFLLSSCAVNDPRYNRLEGFVHCSNALFELVRREGALYLDRVR